jgi:hypothetical protein
MLLDRTLSRQVLEAVPVLSLVEVPVVMLSLEVLLPLVRLSLNLGSLHLAPCLLALVVVVAASFHLFGTG